MSDHKKIFVFGASGHAKVVIDIIERQGCYEIVCLVDDDPALKGATVYGYPVLGGKIELLEKMGTDGPDMGIVAIGSNRARMAVASWLTENGFKLAKAVHPSAQLARGVTVGSGTVIMAGAIINPDSRIGGNVIINSRASVDHDCVIGDGVHIAPGAILCGSVAVGQGTFICAGGTVVPNLAIGKDALVGAGSTVLRDVPDRVKVVGSPARSVPQR